ncbi:hypothetical protein [Clostridium beijerinckii]|uniref:Uncharacterized protein n=1 Tax=Clostridium beijerinckii TaxID=1520 RepID=A0AAE5H7V0_CLOBE|nr:hypothetical protein [Clostridium beijerinckii]NSB15653.1 hypothetical protein [Clostridium beijerinckii]OOM33515.1 hypothetical protein CLOBE_05430 [Clostridium beijerinckii]
MQFNDIKQEITDRGWSANADKLFIELLKEMINNKEDMGREYTINNILEKLDVIRTSGKIDIDDNKSFNTAKKVVFSQRNGRDYFIFKKKEKQDLLTKIIKGNKKGFKWDNYKSEIVTINPRYNMTIVAGDNERNFIDICKKYNLDGLLRGKRTYDNKKKNKEKVSISVDNSIEYEKNQILIEIDSGNMAKLIVGQYTLLNILCENPEDKVFIVIHYYKDYNNMRTVKNLNLVANTLFKDKIMKFKVYNIEEFEETCKKNKGKIKEFINELLN